jgi:hypothetical protein
MSSAPVSEEIRARLREIDLKRAEFLERMAEKQTIASYKEIIHSYAVNIVAENQALPLPKVVEHTYTATEVASMIGTTSWRVGNLAKEYGIKGKPGAVTEYGEWFKDKAAYSDKEVETFRYNQKGIDKLRELYHSWSKREIK